MSYVTVLTQVGILFGMMAVGFVAGKFKIFTEKATKDLSSLLLYVATPAMVINSMIREYDGNLIVDAMLCLGIGIAVFVFGMATSLALSKALKIKKERRSIWVIAASFTNPGFMGFPVALAIFGKDGLFLAAFINLAQNLVLYTWGEALMAKTCEGHVGPGGEVLKKEPLWRTLLSPMNIAAVIGLVIFFFEIPIFGPVHTVIETIGGLVTPLSMMIVGITISKKSLIEVVKDKDAFTSVIFHMILIPLLLLGVLKLIPFREGSIVPAISVLLMTMPIASMTQIFAENYDADPQFASHAVFISNTLCLVTCPLIMMLV